MSKDIGDRFNKGKLRWRNFPLFLIRPLIEVAHYGESKYTTFNFLKGQTILDSTDSLLRHLDTFIDPSKPDVDPESGKHHLAHVAWNALVCLYMLETRPELNDRYRLNPSVPSAHDLRGSKVEPGASYVIEDGREIFNNSEVSIHIGRTDKDVEAKFAFAEGEGSISEDSKEMKIKIKAGLNPTKLIPKQIGITSDGIEITNIGTTTIYIGGNDKHIEAFSSGGNGEISIKEWK